MKCQPRCERLTLGQSDLDGFDLLVCAVCHRPVKLLVQGKPRPKPYRPLRGDEQRALRAARRARMR